MQAYSPSTGAVLAGTTATTEDRGREHCRYRILYGQVSLSAGQNIQVSGTDLADIGYGSAQTITAAGTLAGNNVLTVAGANATIQAVRLCAADWSQGSRASWARCRTASRRLSSNLTSTGAEPDPVTQHDSGRGLRG